MDLGILINQRLYTFNEQIMVVINILQCVPVRLATDISNVFLSLACDIVRPSAHACGESVPANGRNYPRRNDQLKDGLLMCVAL